MGHNDFVHAVGHPRTKEIYIPILDICVLRPAMTYLTKKNSYSLRLSDGFSGVGNSEK